MFVMFSGTSLEADAEDVAWGFVNLFHRAASRVLTQLDRASDEVRALLAAADGLEVHSSNLEEQIERAQAAEASMMAFEQMREVAASLYLEETGSSWKPFVGSRLNHSRKVTSAVVEARDFLRARAERRRDAHSPEGTAVIFAGGRSSFASADEAKAFASNVWATLDKVRDRVPDMLCPCTAATAKVLTGWQPPGPNATMSSNWYSTSIGGSEPVPASSATSRCSKWTRAMSSPFPAMAYLSDS